MRSTICYDHFYSWRWWKKDIIIDPFLVPSQKLLLSHDIVWMGQGVRIIFHHLDLASHRSSERRAGLCLLPPSQCDYWWSKDRIWWNESHQSVIQLIFLKLTCNAAVFHKLQHDIDELNQNTFQLKHAVFSNSIFVTQCKARTQQKVFVSR